MRRHQERARYGGGSQTKKMKKELPMGDLYGLSFRDMCELSLKCVIEMTYTISQPCSQDKFILLMFATTPRLPLILLISQI